MPTPLISQLILYYSLLMISNRYFLKLMRIIPFEQEQMLFYTNIYRESFDFDSIQWLFFLSHHFLLKVIKINHDLVFQVNLIF